MFIPSLMFLKRAQSAVYRLPLWLNNTPLCTGTHILLFSRSHFQHSVKALIVRVDSGLCIPKPHGYVSPSI